MDDKTSQDILRAGTGFMIGLADTIRRLQLRGYNENLVPQFDHLESQSGAVHFYPEDIQVDRVVRFENSSDPDDQAILYAVTSSTRGLKGLYVESYGTYHDELSAPMLKKLTARARES